MFRRRERTRSLPAFTFEVSGSTTAIALKDGSTRIPMAEWSSRMPRSATALATLEAMDEGVSFGPDEVLLAPSAVAAIDSATADALGLPPPTRLALDLRPVGRIDEDDFHIATRWVQPGGFSTRTAMEGALLRSETGLRRVPEPVWSLYAAASAMAAPRAREDRFRALARLQEVWPQDPSAAVASEAYLQDLRVHYASAMSLKIRTLTPDTTEFDPLLFSPAAIQGDTETLDEGESVLSPASQRLFAEDRFVREADARPVYVLRNGEYVFVDPALRPALGVARTMRDAPEEERRRFVLNPRKTIRERLGDDLAERIGLERVFIETEQFSERVAGVDVWRPPVLPWLAPPGGSGWLPERFGLRIGDDYFTVEPSGVPALIERVEAAAGRGEPDVDVADLVSPVAADTSGSEVRLPISEQSISSLEALRPLSLAHEGGAADGDEPPSASDLYGGRLFLVVRDNFEEVEYEAPEPRPAADLVPVDPPALLRSTLKPHQRVGLDWLVAAHRSGLPGVLLADDMGLGKTLQAIAFMAWRRQEAKAGRLEHAPALIVAPTGLLGTWRQEIERHLDEPALGPLVAAFGSALRQLREDDGFSQRDIDTGRAALSAEAWRDAGVVLTTYETMRDYHFSFARTRFGLVVFDEVQKLKNPASQVTRASLSLNSDFTLGMTGTPVENRLQDLWSVMNAIAPGVLGSSREFERRHAASDRQALAALQSRLSDPQNGVPPLLLRRMKSEILDGLPRKHVHPFRLEMPPLQANAYRDVVVRAAAAAAGGNLGKGGMLSALAEMRGISLHPVDPREAPADLASYASDSARLTHALTVLEEVSAKREKALFFVEDLAMQERLAVLIQSRFGLRRTPWRINGRVPGPRRQEIVNDFQSRPGEFDVLILSPRAGGVGLTITAANHVVHLSRWWNPAVEDQATDRVFRIGQEREVHVHLPLAVHPDPAIGPSSFDLRLDALIERKRALTRDLFMPPEAGDAELNELFREVSLASEGSRDAEEEQDASPATPAAPPPDDIADSVESSPSLEQTVAAEKSLSPVTPIAPALQAPGIRYWRLEAGDERPTRELMAAFAGSTLAQVAIRDPYGLCTKWSRAAQVRFLRELADSARVIEAITIEYAPEIDGDLDESVRRREVGSLMVRNFPNGVPNFALVRRARRGPDDDFHDRFVDIEVRGPDGALRRHTITIGRGLQALYEDNRQCTVTYVPPLGA